MHPHPRIYLRWCRGTERLVGCPLIACHGYQLDISVTCRGASSCNEQLLAILLQSAGESAPRPGERTSLPCWAKCMEAIFVIVILLMQQLLSVGSDVKRVSSLFQRRVAAMFTSVSGRSRLQVRTHAAVRQPRQESYGGEAGCVKNSRQSMVLRLPACCLFMTYAAASPAALQFPLAKAAAPGRLTRAKKPGSDEGFRL